MWLFLSKPDSLAVIFYPELADGVLQLFLQSFHENITWLIHKGIEF